jgi:hypothetical protein
LTADAFGLLISTNVSNQSPVLPSARNQSRAPEGPRTGVAAFERAVRHPERHRPLDEDAASGAVTVVANDRVTSSGILFVQIV